jgi:hypothetical protein
MSKMGVEQFRSFAGKVVERLPDNLGPYEAQFWMENPGSLGTELYGLLRHIPLHLFFQSRPGLCISEDFQRFILEPGLQDPQCAAAMVRHRLDLSEGVSGQEMIKRLGGVYEFPRALMLHFAYNIRAQPNGDDGEWLTNGNLNVYPVRGLGAESFMATTLWDEGRRRWSLHASSANQYPLFAGTRVCSDVESLDI